tara:strand:- start:102 stop:1013 length:912 start_codon:yes stop_codon:yes gene_type:complete
VNSNKLRYVEFISNFEDISVFSQPWWLDLVCGPDNWDVALVERDGRPVATLPYFIKKKWFLKALTQPPLTQVIEPLFAVKPENDSDKKSKLMSELISHLPRVSRFQLNLHSNFTNWLPFYWAGYSQTTYYTYILDSTKDEDYIWKNMSGKRRTEIRKSINNEIKISSDGSLETFYTLYHDTFSRKNRKPPYSKAFINNLINVCLERKSGKLLFSKNQEGTTLSSAFFVWDNKKTYYLLGGLNSKENTMGAQSLLLWEAIKHSLESSRSFDFEGSMDKGVGQFFSSFGSKQTEYYSISKKSLII